MSSNSQGDHGDPGGDGDLQLLAARLEHPFDDIDLLKRAVTHRSAASASSRKGHYERLEFLGDRVLGLVIAELLFRRFPREAEGELARRHAALVRGEALSEVAEDIDLAAFLRLAKGEEEAGERENRALLANACEAVIAALYLDGGLPAAERFICAHWMALLKREPQPPRDSKTALQEWAQGQGFPLPNYRETARLGPPHDPVFTVAVEVQGEAPATGQGRSKRKAEQDAAGRLLARIEAGREESQT
jgi:ribonuclease-3